MNKKEIQREDVVAELAWNRAFVPVQENLLSLDEEDSNMSVMESARRTARYYDYLRSKSSHPRHTVYRLAQIDLNIHPEW